MYLSTCWHFLKTTLSLPNSTKSSLKKGHVSNSSIFAHFWAAQSMWDRKLKLPPEIPKITFPGESVCLAALRGSPPSPEGILQIQWKGGGGRPRKLISIRSMTLASLRRPPRHTAVAPPAPAVAPPPPPFNTPSHYRSPAALGQYEMKHNLVLNYYIL